MKHIVENKSDKKNYPNNIQMHNSNNPYSYCMNHRDTNTQGKFLNPSTTQLNNLNTILFSYMLNNHFHTTNNFLQTDNNPVYSQNTQSGNHISYSCLDMVNKHQLHYYKNQLNSAYR